MLIATRLDLYTCWIVMEYSRAMRPAIAVLSQQVITHQSPCSP